jgi:tetratricopeptide (TPR) repeat protein
MKKGLFIVFLIGYFSFAQAPEDLFRAANNAYNQGEYERAVMYYDSIHAQGVHSAELYFNLGNAHYKRNAIAPSILNYERALLLDPSNDDIRNNLVYAQNMTLDRFSPLPESDLKELSRDLLQLNDVRGWSVLSIAACWLAAIFFVFYVRSSNSTWKRVYFSAFVLLGLLILMSLAAALQQKGAEENTQPAIVFSETESFRSEPNLRSEVLLTIHEGTKVYVQEALEGWVKIRLVNGAVGWIPQSSMIYIRPIVK